LFFPATHEFRLAIVMPSIKDINGAGEVLRLKLEEITGFSG
jgi:hypothetical protein